MPKRSQPYVVTASHKQCHCCMQLQVKEDFYKSYTRRGGVRDWCKTCEKKYNNQYHKKNSKQIVQRKRLNQKKDPDKRRLYELNKRHTDPVFKLKKNLRRRLLAVLKGKTKKGSSIKLLGCSPEQLRIYLESKFKDGMKWDNYSFKGWHVDHIKPLASFDLTDEEQLKQACHYTNLQPLWREDNLRKCDKILVGVNNV